MSKAAHQASSSVRVRCSECGADIGIPTDAAEGELLSCPDCGVEYEVEILDRQSNRVSLKIAHLEAEDWGE